MHEAPGTSKSRTRLSTHSVSVPCHWALAAIFKIGVQLLYSVGLFSAVEQSESAMHVYVYFLFLISFPSRSPQSPE